MEKSRLLKLYLILGIVTVCLLAGGLIIRLQTASRVPPTDTASAARPTDIPISRIPHTATASATFPTYIPSASAVHRTNIPTNIILSTDAAPEAVTINVPTIEYPTIPPSAPAFTVPLHSTDPSGMTGTATFKEIAGSVAILLHLDRLPDDEESIMPVELRFGTCAALGDLAYPMSVPDGGESETDLSIDLKQFDAQKPMAVVLYRSPQDPTMIACGDIP